MCKCTPNIRTPFCGKLGCVWPEQKPQPKPDDACRWCGFTHGPQCPVVKSIEFYEDGVTVKRLEYKTANDFPPLVLEPARSPWSNVEIYTELPGEHQPNGGRYVGLERK